MKRLLSSILIIMALSSASYAAATKTEIIEEEVCHAVAGCWINPKTGECPDCVIETRKIVTIIEDKKEKKTFAVKPLIVKKTSPAKVGKKCFFPELGWPKDDGTMTGEYRDCNWRNRGSNTAAAVERGIRECGGLMNWTWTDEHHTEYICNKG